MQIPESTMSSQEIVILVINPNSTEGFTHVSPSTRHSESYSPYIRQCLLIYQPHSPPPTSRTSGSSA
jgi:hypothetical protein